MGQQNYKIFINHYTIFIGDDKFMKQQPEMITDYSLDKMGVTISKILSGTNVKDEFIGFTVKDTLPVYKQLKKHFKLIKAAGGIVFNHHGELLLIKRLGLWDLPKGKIESGEDQRLAALREVREECGLNFLGLLNKIAYTYHAYFLKGRWILKRTTWYKMAALGDISVTPQLEEHITEVKWVNKDFLKQPDFETYDSLKSLINKIEFPKIKHRLL
jgi:8-oxo-dGTP pyrophosphatase MutT (NUDIX family)